MKFLADESCDFAVVRGLRAAGYDVVAVSEYQQRSVDSELIDAAFADGRILLTEDKDFGWLCFVAHAASAGVVLFRFPAKQRGTLGGAAVQLVATQGEALRHSFVVLSPGLTRISRPPGCA